MGVEDVEDLEERLGDLLPQVPRQVRRLRGVHVKERGDAVEQHLGALHGPFGDGCQKREHLDLLLPVDAFFATQRHDLAQLGRDHLVGDLLRVHGEKAVLGALRMGFVLKVAVGTLVATGTLVAVVVAVLHLSGVRCSSIVFVQLPSAPRPRTIRGWHERRRFGPCRSGCAS